MKWIGVPDDAVVYIETAKVPTDEPATDNPNIIRGEE